MYVCYSWVGPPVLKIPYVGWLIILKAVLLFFPVANNSCLRQRTLCRGSGTILRDTKGPRECPENCEAVMSHGLIASGIPQFQLMK